MNRITKILMLFTAILIPSSLQAKGECLSSDQTYYEDCILQNISSLVSEKKYSYAIDLLNAYEDWYKDGKGADPKTLAKILSGKAAVYYFKGDYGESLKVYSESLKYYIAEKNSSKIAETKMNMSIVAASMNNYADAMKLIKEAEEYYKGAKKPVDLADALFNKGIFYFFSNDFGNAFDSLSEAEKLCFRAGLKIRYLSAQVLKGIMKAKSGEYKDALYLCQDNLLSFSLKYYCIALANDGLGKKEEAKRAYQKAIEKINKNVNSALEGSGNEAAQAVSEKYAPVFTDYLLFMLKSSVR